MGRPQGAPTRTLTVRMAEETADAITRLAVKAELAPSVWAKRRLGEAVIGRLLADAFDHANWVILGFDSWEDYLATDFQFDPEYAAALIRCARVSDEIEIPAEGEKP